MADILPPLVLRLPGEPTRTREVPDPLFTIVRRRGGRRRWHIVYRDGQLVGLRPVDGADLVVYVHADDVELASE